MDGQQQRGERAGQNWQNSRMSANGARSATAPHRRNDGRWLESRRPGAPSYSMLTQNFPESWVEISSQPSSSSLSSIGDEIVTTGLRVGGSMAARRRRLHHQPVPRSFHVDQTTIHAGTSSQEEYEESESEEDRLLTSSTENVQPSVRPPFPAQQAAQVESEDSDDSDEIATALGRVPDDPVFRPQPNAFSHPPSTLNRSHSANSAIHQHPHSSVRPSLSHRSQTRVHRSPPNFMSPAYQADNDAALRASLTTLLSCAAAARGLPKYKDSEQQGAPAHAGVGLSSQPVELRLMPESELMADRPPPQPQGTSPAKTPARSRTATSSTPSSPRSDGVDKHKRTSSSQTRSSRATKKKKVAAGEDTLISPTLLTWVVSAGVVVLVSVVGFGAGYVIGREVGRQEALSAAGVGVNASTVADSSSCGREVIRSSGGGLRRLRWGAGVGRSVVA
ncbi:hypothetical protein CSOJ01_10457 [Colletotrichum sojae]|uniref:Uncharacterized protein n=1 Tax=Colletotrichum sojae TaxID=2175907 RepID=A0A8H6J069_9PEZI|nr:hypothetical protein CSOJ01_10457 [Colletotrichum sojae]